MSTQDCQFCNRRGLPLLPLRLAYVPNHKTSLPSSLTSGNPNLHSVKDGAYALRIITEGYVYILDMRAGGFWRCFAATQTGHFKELPLDALPAQQPSFQCGRTGHANVSSIVSIERASEGGEVWVGYSRVHWTQATRAKIKQDANLRAAAMVQFNAAAVVTGGNLPPHSGLRLTSGDQLASLVGEYAKDETGFSHIDRLYANATTAGAAERRGQADELVKAMHHISPNNAIVLALPDTIGIAQDINHWRNIRAGELAKFQGDAAKLRTRIIGDMILDIESSMRKQGQGSVWDERYAPKVEMKKVRADKLAHTKKVTEIEALILRASDDWCKWTASTQFKLAWQLYDGMDAQHGKSVGSAMERDFAGCVFGSGATPKEQKWWEEYLTADPSDTNHALWLAFAAGDKDVVAFLKGDAAKPLDMGKLDKGIDLVKQSKDLAEKLREWHSHRTSARLLRAVQAESGLLATTIASQLAVLGRAKPQAALIAGQRLRLVIVSRMEVLVTPYGQQVTLKQMVVQMHEAVWGPPKSQMSKVVQEARSLKIAQGIDGAWLGSKFTSTKVVAVEVWMPETAVGLGNSKASPKALPVPDTPILNPWQGLTQYIKNSKALGQGLLGLGAALQISNLSANLIQLDRASKGNAANRDDSITESLYGVVSGSLGLLALTGEVFAGSIAARAVPAAATAGTARLLTIAGWTALGGGYWGARQQALMHSNRLEKQTG